jgi:hypothetical protein
MLHSTLSTHAAAALVVGLPALPLAGVVAIDHDRGPTTSTMRCTGPRSVCTTVLFGEVTRRMDQPQARAGSRGRGRGPE